MPFITHEKTNWRFLFIVVVIALISGGSILWLGMRQDFYYETPEIKIPKKVLDEFADSSSIASATEDWQTYRNEEYGFEMKYPGEWESSIHFLGDTQMLDVDVIKIPKNNFPNAAITNIEIQIVIDKRDCRRGESSEDTYRIEKNILISKESFQIAAWSYTPPTFGYEYSTQKNGLCYEITLIFKGENTNEFWDYYNKGTNPFFNIFDQMLSTFRFIK
jgi:hypothetical protein